jgi:hypothetical protein
VNSSEYQVERLVRTWNELAGRSTTMAKDIHVIIANLLNFHADIVMELETETMTRNMILSFECLPFSFFFNIQDGDLGQTKIILVRDC